MHTTNSVLLAIWPKGRCPMLEDPWRIVWGDRTPATLNDYHTHQHDTTIQRRTPQGATILYLYPDVIADLRWDPWGGRWSLTGAGIRPVALWVDDPRASEDLLQFAIRGLPIEYRVIIHRS